MKKDELSSVGHLFRVSIAPDCKTKLHLDREFKTKVPNKKLFCLTEVLQGCSFNKLPTALRVIFPDQGNLNVGVFLFHRYFPLLNNNVTWQIVLAEGG